MSPPISDLSFGKITEMVSVLERDVAQLKEDVRNLRQWHFEMRGIIKAISVSFAAGGLLLTGLNVALTLWLGH